MSIKIKNWSVVTTFNPYTPPETQKASLNGNVYGHPRFEDGKNVITSTIVEVNGNIVKTYSGSVYELEEPCPDFVEWCEKNGHYVPTKEVPIKWKS